MCVCHEITTLYDKFVKKNAQHGLCLIHKVWRKELRMKNSLDNTGIIEALIRTIDEKYKGFNSALNSEIEQKKLQSIAQGMELAKETTVEAYQEQRKILTECQSTEKKPLEALLENLQNQHIIC